MDTNNPGEKVMRWEIIRIRKWRDGSQDGAAFLLFWLFGTEEDSTDGLIEDLLEGFLSKRTTFHVSDGFDLPGQTVPLHRADRAHSSLVQPKIICFDTNKKKYKPVNGASFSSEICLGSDENNWSSWAMLRYFGVPKLVAKLKRRKGTPFGADIFEADRINEGKTEKEDVGLRV